MKALDVSAHFDPDTPVRVLSSPLSSAVEIGDLAGEVVRISVGHSHESVLWWERLATQCEEAAEQTRLVLHEKAREGEALTSPSILVQTASGEDVRAHFGKDES